jgi:CubicO group peptidase (beta-lactamase class C family)
MEFNVFEYFKGYQRTSRGPMSAEEQGTSYFLAGHMGERIREHVDDYAAKAGLSRRSFLGTASGFAAAMLAVNKITGMRFFDVTEAEAYDPAAAQEIKVTRKPGQDFIVDAHTHICTRKDGYIPGVNTSDKGMWFVQLLDDLGKANGLANGTKDMTPANFGKMILEGSDTSVAIFNPFGFREDYGGKDMIPIEEQAEVKQQWPDRTAMLGGGLSPNQGLSVTLERLQMFVEKYKIAGLKLYTFDSTPKRGWWFDDQKKAYPIWERCRKLGIKNIGCHKGSRSVSSWPGTRILKTSMRQPTIFAT